ncbi:MAG: hypothetical protein ACRC20_03590 [Segniliparus sp.]|uniref:hypothetical protein n=1 Tax=Segniliparus sp. TaxID=2804064 RepID=UPI003F2C2653
MTISAQRACAAALAATAACTGVWALFFPLSFYTDFPLFGSFFHHWVDGLGPYNEHLIRDVGGFYAGLGAMSAWAALRAEPGSLRLLGLGWTVFNLAHLAFHLQHLAMFAVPDQVGMTAVLGGSLVLSALMLRTARK